MGKRGTIVRIYMKNFGNYREVLMYPGAYLNLILGPNGTGKSTIVSAIVLALGGNPKVIGRASQIGDYVKRNCQDSIIEVELDSGDTINRNIIITRHFNKANNTKWKLNGKLAQHKEFLPQDRVQDFAKMNNRELLINTQKSVGPIELSNYHNELINFRITHKELENKLTKFQSTLTEANQQNERVSSLIKNIQEKESLLLKLKHLQGKLAWIEYDIKRNKVVDTKKDKQSAEEQMKKHRDKLRPMEAEIEKLKSTISNIQQEILDKNRAVNNIYNSIKNKIERVEDVGRKISLIKNEFDRKLEEENEKERLIKENNVKVEKLQSDFNSLRNSDSDIHHEEEIENIKMRVMEIANQMEQLNMEKTKRDYVLDNIKHEIDQINEERRNLEHVGRQRLDLLKRLDVDVYNSVLWLRKNKHLFQGNVYEPILLEINVTNPDHAKFIENIIPLRDLCVFTCEQINDMNLLIENLRVKQNLRISVVHSGQEHTPYNEYKPPVPISKLQKYGFYAYANTLISGPEPILKYLCRSYRIHSIPIGNDLVNDKYEEVPPNVSVFFSNTKRFAVTISSYTSEKSTRISDINSNRLLNLSLNVDKMNALKQKMSEINSNKLGVERKVTEIEQQIQTLNQERTMLMSRRKELTQKKDKLNIIQTRLQAAIQHLTNLKATVIDINTEREKYKTKIKSILEQLIDNQNSIANDWEKHKTHLIEVEIKRAELDAYQGQVMETTKKSQELKLACNKLEHTLMKINEQLEAYRAEAKAQFDRAKILTDSFTPGDKDNFKKFNEIFNRLPDSVDDLNDNINDLETKVGCIGNVNENVLQEYKNRQNLIENVTKQIENTSKEMNSLLERIEEIKALWLGPLEELIQKINLNFERYFHRMGCEGHVSLIKSDNDLDFDLYGLSIKVSYRVGEIAQELDQYTQSGGERAVATAIYMLSLQELTHVPFRCVDEINQGMDAINERKVFELIVNSTTENNTSQYFLLTPKLLPGLNYTDRMKIHVIHNGPGEKMGEQYNVENVRNKSQKFDQSQQSFTSNSILSGSPDY